MLAPLRFQPVFKNYLWGGRRLETLLGKSLGEGPHWAESWEVVDHGDDQSEVTDGPQVGMTLKEICQEHGSDLFGRHADQEQFPLLLKYLDAHRTLSVQVHPNDEQGARLDPPDLGKTEAWVVLAAEPGSKIYAGLKPGVTREQLAAAIDEGTCADLLHTIEPEVGDCVFIEAGTVHALGEGLVIAEIQQASNTTFRLFDWNRVDTDGKPRPLHIEQSLQTIDFSRGPVAPQVPQPTDTASRVRLVNCDKFVLDRITINDDTQDWPVDNRFHILTVVAGDACHLLIDGSATTLAKGETLLVPACCGEIAARSNTRCEVLDMYLP